MRQQRMASDLCGHFQWLQMGYQNPVEWQEEWFHQAVVIEKVSQKKLFKEEKMWHQYQT